MVFSAMMRGTMVELKNGTPVDWNLLMLFQIKLPRIQQSHYARLEAMVNAAKKEGDVLTPFEELVPFLAAFNPAPLTRSKKSEINKQVSNLLLCIIREEQGKIEICDPLSYSENDNNFCVPEDLTS